MYSQAVRHSLISIAVILSLAAVIFCGMMACLEFLNHYSVLAGSIPVQPLAGLSVLMAVVIAALVAIPHGAIAVFLPTLHREPDPTLWRPLQLAFSDGILNTKVF